MLDVEAAAHLVDSAAVAYPLPRDLLVVTGGDAATYLQGQLSQDVEGLAVGTTTRTLLLQPQGKVDAWLRVHRRGPAEFWLDLDPGHGEAATARLERFKLRVEVTIEPRTVEALAVRGPQAPTEAPDGLVALDAGWGGIGGLDLVDPTGAAVPASVADQLGIPLGPPELAEAVRVRQGQPAMGPELDDSTIPAAAGVVDASVDFTKGCYVGQELVARVDSRGSNTPTRLHTLRSSGELAAGDELLLDGEAVGRVTSAASWPGAGPIGLGYLKRSVTAPVELASSSGAVVSADPLPASPPVAS